MLTMVEPRIGIDIEISKPIIPAPVVAKVHLLRMPCIYFKTLL